MATRNPKGQDATERLTNLDEDAREERPVLREVLFLYPETLTSAELVRELTVDAAEFAERDRVQRAVRDLVAGGLLHRVDDLVLPTRAAVKFHLLMDL